MNNCAVCTKIVAAVLRSPELEPSEKVDLGTWGEYMERKSCSSCQWIVQYFLDRYLREHPRLLHDFRP